MKELELINIIKNKINKEECFDCKNIDGCRVKCSDCLLKVRFDNCANIYFGVDGGCDCIIILKNKIALIECKNGKFGSSDAKKASEQIKKCFKFIKNKGYSGYIEGVIYFRYIDSTSKSRVEIELRHKRKIPVKFCKCGEDMSSF